MASVTNSGITTTSKNVCIPLANAGIGDAIAMKNDTDGSSKDHFIAVVGKSVQATPPSGYIWYGTVYGREKNGLMIRALAPAEKQWASTTQADVTVNLDTTNHASVIANTITYAGILRNGGTPAKDVNVGMNVGVIISRCGTSSTSTALHPNSPKIGDGTPPMSEANFEADTNRAKTIYGTYENYVSQVLTIMKGGRSGVFSKRCGKANTRELATANSTDGYNFPAATYCYGYKAPGIEGNNHWWLPDMYELAVMMSDASFEACQHAHSVLGGNTERASYRWSCVRYSSTRVWFYFGNGFSSVIDSNSSLCVCPVTLIPL